MTVLNGFLAFCRMFSRNKAYPSLMQTIRRRLQIWSDKRAGLDFLLVIRPQDLGFDEGLVHRGSPSGNKYLHKVLVDLEIRPTDAILDVGCAKGSAMRTMLDFPFLRVDGVEISEKLADIAAENFRKLEIDNAKIFNADAVNFSEYGNYNLFYLYNPFPEEVMRHVVAALARQSNPEREVVIIYNAPKCHDLLASHGFIAIRDYPDQWGNGIRVYSTRPASSRLLVGEDGQLDRN